MLIQNFPDQLATWIDENFLPILFSVLTVIISYLLYILIKKQVSRLKRKERITETNAKNLTSLLKISIYIVVLIILSIQFTELFGTFAGIFTVAGGTIIGFAGINTIGNIIAGLIVILSRPFEVGDRIDYLNRLADVVDIKLVYTVLKDVDGVIISVPNQELLKTEIKNYGKDRILRREIFASIGYDVSLELVEKALLEATTKFKTILKFPEPRVDVYELGNFAINYRLLVYVSNSKILPKFDHDLRKEVLISCIKYGIDLSTPSMVQAVSGNSKNEPAINVSQEQMLKKASD